MRKQIEGTFPQCVDNGCIEESTESVFFIADAESDKKQPCQIVAEEEAHLTVKNPNEKNISLLKIDQCLFFDDSGHKKCDCAVFDDKTFCFVEMKASKRKKRTERRNEAMEQLEASIKMFQEKEIDFAQYKQKAIICFLFKLARPVASTRFQQTQVVFQDKYQVELLEKSEITFP